MTPAHSSYSILVIRHLGTKILYANLMTTQMTSRMTTREVIAEKLTKAFAPERLEVIDDSHRHAGHAGARPGGETHYSVHIVSQAFPGKSRIHPHPPAN